MNKFHIKNLCVQKVGYEDSCKKFENATDDMIG